MVTEVRLLQRSNAPSPIEVTELGMFTLVRLLQLQKAYLPIKVTEFGIATEVIPLQDKKALSPIEVTVLGMIVFLHPVIRVFDAVSIIALQLLRESYFTFPLSTLMLIKSQHSNAWSQIDVTEFGIVIFVRPSQ